MNRTQYISQPIVADFVDFVASSICGNFPHQYIIRLTRTSWSCKNIADAAAQYRWPANSNKSLQSTNTDLLKLERQLKEAIARNCSTSLETASLDVLRWGGVLPRNAPTLASHQKNLVRLFKATMGQLHFNGDDQQLNHVFNMNSGFSKIYSLLSPGIIIYDGRVGAALGLLALHFSAQQGLKKIPNELLFPYAPPHESSTATFPKNRDPLQFTHRPANPSSPRFPVLGGNRQRHSQFILRASWIVDEAAQKCRHNCLKSKKHSLGKPLKVSWSRFIEAGLFMIGYDLPLPKVKNLSAATRHGASPKYIPIGRSKAIASATFETLGRRNPFTAALVECRAGKPAGLDCAVGRIFPLEDIRQVLLWLAEKHGTGAFFPLDNSATKVRQGNGNHGLGTAFFDIFNRAFNPPDASRIAAVLVAAGILEQACDKTLRLRVAEIPTTAELKERLHDALVERHE